MSLLLYFSIDSINIDKIMKDHTFFYLPSNSQLIANDSPEGDNEIVIAQRGVLPPTYFRISYISDKKLLECRIQLEKTRVLQSSYISAVPRDLITLSFNNLYKYRSVWWVDCFRGLYRNDEFIFRCEDLDDYYLLNTESFVWYVYRVRSYYFIYKYNKITLELTSYKQKFRGLLRSLFFWNGDLSLHFSKSDVYSLFTSKNSFFYTPVHSRSDVRNYLVDETTKNLYCITTENVVNWWDGAVWLATNISVPHFLFPKYFIFINNGCLYYVPEYRLGSSLFVITKINLSTSEKIDLTIDQTENREYPCVKVLYFGGWVTKQLNNQAVDVCISLNSQDNMQETYVIYQKDGQYMSENVETRNVPSIGQVIWTS